MKFLTYMLPIFFTQLKPVPNQDQIIFYLSGSWDISARSFKNALEHLELDFRA